MRAPIVDDLTVVRTDARKDVRKENGTDVRTDVHTDVRTDVLRIQTSTVDDLTDCRTDVGKDIGSTNVHLQLLNSPPPSFPFYGKAVRGLKLLRIKAQTIQG